MRIKLSVEFANGEARTLTAIYPDLAKFEEIHQRSVAKFATDIRLSDLGWLAWHVLHRQGETKATYEDWCQTVEVVQPDDSEGEPDAPLDR